MKLTITPTQTRIIILALYTLLPLVGWGQQVIGSFPNMDGGFENQTTGTPATASSIATGAERTDWSVQNTSGTASISNTGGRSGPKFITYGATAARRLQSPTVGNAELVNATSYTVQFFYKSTASPSNGQVGNSPDGTAQPGTYVGLTLTNTSGVWTKVTQSQTSGSSSNSPRYGISIIRFSAASGTDIDVDDFVVYAGAVDNSAPNSPGTVTVSNPTNTTLDVSWGVASGGVDGGGYVVVRYAVNPNVDNDPNQNGIYAVGNTFTNGTGSLTGTVRYIGTGTSFTDNVGLSAGTQYWYKVYTVDKAFNYSNESQGTGTTSVCTTPTNITGLSLTPGNGQITVSWTNPACLDEVMIVAKASSSIIATPTGDGSLYTANLAFGSGTAFDGGHVVYKGAASPQTITGLTNGTTYFVKVFTRRGTTWTSGVESSAVPAIQPIVWSNTGASTAWYTNTNWTPNTNSIQWQTFNVAQFQNSGTATTAGINMNTAQLSIGAIEITAARTRILTIGNSSTTSGTLSLNGAFVNAVDNTVIRNNSNYNLTIQDNETGTGKTMNVALLNATNNIIAADANGNIFISSQITSASGPITITGSGSGIVEFSGQNTYTTETVVAGSTLRLNRTGGNTLPATNNIKVEGGTLRISTNQTINNLTLTGGTITIDPGVTLTINGTVTRTGGSIDASATGATIVFGNTSPITLPAGLFSGAIQNLTISGTGGVTAGSNLTVNGVLNLAASNPNNNRGLLEMTINYANYADTRVADNTNVANNLNSHILTMGPSATTTGQGDVTGKIRRTAFTSGTMYTFGNANTQLTFTGSDLPTQITVVSTRGSEGLHVDKSNSVQRLYQVLRTGGVDPTTMTIRLAYDDTELNSNNEANLVLWDHHIPYGGVSPHEHGKTNQNTSENWVELTNHLISYLSTEGTTGFTKYWMISNKESVGDNIWLGATNNVGPDATNWSNPSNWAAGILPTATADVIMVPNAPRTAVLGGTITLRTINIGANTTLNGSSATLVLDGGPLTDGGNGSWINQGTFLPGTSTIRFNNDEATIGGNTQFFNLEVAAAKKATLQADANATILNQLTLGSGATFVGANNSKVIYGGTSQTVTAADYHSLEINATSGTTTMPAALSIKGNLTTNTATDFTTNSTVFTMNGNAAQSIGGSNASALHQLVVNNALGVSLNRDVTINNDLTLTTGFLAIGARTLTLNGTTSGSGGIRGGNTSNLVTGGSGSIDLRMDQTTRGSTNRLGNLTYNKNTTLLDTLEVTGVITPTAGQLNTQHMLKLISTATGTARIATGSGAYIIGNVVAERFVPATGGRRWRFMSSPVANATIEDWRGEIFVTGGSGSTTLGTTNTGGFDASPNNNPSIFSYDETNTDPSVNVGWVAPTATTEALTPGKGFRVFVRGDRSNTAMLTNSPPAVNAVTVNVVGSVNSGNIVIPITCTPSGPASTYHNNSDGWNLLGNPYPSDYDWNAFYDANSAALELFIEPTVWVYNAITGTYSSYNAESNLGGLTGGIIPSGAAFWVKAKTLGSHNITLTENFKTNTQAINVFKHTEDAGFVVRMVRDSINSSELHIKYKTGATTNFDVMDIRHLPGTVNIAAYGSDSIRLAASARPLTTLSDTIRLDVSGSNGSYTFNFFNTEYIDLLDEVYLIDNYLNQVVNLKQTNQYAFGISSSLPTTFGANRFMIVVANANPVPVSLAVFNAKVVGQKQVALDWVTVSEVNSSKFEVEHSTNGKQFNTIGNVKAQGNSAKIHNYRFIHKDAAAVNYYRLKMIDMDGSFTTSVVRMVRFDGINESEISLWPIPASQQISVNGVSNEEPVGYIVTDAMGQTVLTGMWSAHTTHELWIENLPQGMYFIKLNSETSNNTFRFIKQ